MCKNRNSNELSATAKKFIEKVSDSRVLPYSIQGSWWFISGTVCRKCNELKTVTLLKGRNGKEKLTEPELAERLWAFYDEITAPGDPSQHQTEYMKELYDAVQETDKLYKDSVHDEAMGVLEELLRELTEDEIKKLIEKWNLQEKMIDYAEGCSYRHTSK